MFLWLPWIRWGEWYIKKQNLPFFFQHVLIILILRMRVLDQNIEEFCFSLALGWVGQVVSKTCCDYNFQEVPLADFADTWISKSLITPILKKCTFLANNQQGEDPATYSCLTGKVRASCHPLVGRLSGIIPAGPCICCWEAYSSTFLRHNNMFHSLGEFQVSISIFTNRVARVLFQTVISVI